MRDDIPTSRREQLADRLREETTGGILLIVAAIIAIVWANSPFAHSYVSLTSTEFGFTNFSMPLNVWAADFLLAIFFFVVGIELKHEFVAGSLSSVRRAIVPFTAAFGGMFVAAIIFLAFNYDSDVAKAWGIPISTDIAFALAILAIAGKSMPGPLRAFLLTLAVVNDLGAILVIAVFYGHGFELKSFLIASVLVVAFALLQRTGIRSVALYLPIALACWYFAYESGIHATVAGVALGLSMRVTERADEHHSPGDHVEHVLRPISAGLCVPLFALMSAGVSLEGVHIGEMLTNPLTLGVLCGLVIGQPLGVVMGTFIGTRFTQRQLPPGLTWADVVVVGTLASIGFTVALLVSEVSFGEAPEILTIAKFALVLTSFVSIASAVTAMKLRSRSLS